MDNFSYESNSNLRCLSVRSIQLEEFDSEEDDTSDSSDEEEDHLALPPDTDVSDSGLRKDHLMTIVSQ